MNVGKLIGLYLACVVAFLALGFVWIAIATPRLYKPYLGPLLAEKPNLGAAVAFWRGALLGLLAYATYDLTNLATIQGRAWQVSAPGRRRAFGPMGSA